MFQPLASTIEVTYTSLSWTEGLGQLNGIEANLLYVFELDLCFPHASLSALESK
jgi:hypothetical protein